MIDDGLKKILKGSTMIAQLCSNPLLVRIDEIDKATVAIVGEKQINTSSVPPTSIEIEDQSTSTKKLSVIIETLVALSLVPLVSTKKALVIVEKDGT